MNRSSLKVLGVIPARFKSSRYEGKPLVKIAGVPMLLRTFRRAEQATRLSKLLVATDDERIAEFCKQNGLPFEMTSESCKSGTDRVAEVGLRSPEYDVVVNIQGDEPVIDPNAVDQAIELYEKYGETYLAYNLYKKIDSPEEAEATTSIKVVVNDNDELIYMSRLPVPYLQKPNASFLHYKQVCVYLFTKQGLKYYVSRDRSRNESFEEIDMLRFLDGGHKVKMAETQGVSLSVDVPADVKKVEQFLAQNPNY